MEMKFYQTIVDLLSRNQSSNRGLYQDSLQRKTTFVKTDTELSTTYNKKKNILKSLVVAGSILYNRPFIHWQLHIVQAEKAEL